MTIVHRMAKYMELSTADESYKLLSGSDKDEDERPKNTDEREEAHLLSGSQTAMMIFKFCVGAGWFSIPSAFRYSGVLVGVVWIFACGGLTVLGMQRLVETSWEVARRTGTKTAYFGDIGSACVSLLDERYGFIGRLIVDIILAISSFSLACPMLLFIADVWKQAFEEQTILKLDLAVWILIVYVLILPSTFIRRPDFLGWWSLIANIIEVITIVSLFVNIFFTSSSWKVQTSVEWSKIPLTIGIIFYAFEIAPFILSVENKTRIPKRLPLIINVVMFTVSCFYAVAGTIGYISCYPECQDSVILNLPSIWYYSVTKVLIGFAACCSLVLIFFVVYDTVDPILKFQVPENRFHVTSLLFRILTVTLSAGITASVPQLANVMSLAGSFVTSTVGFLFPAVSHTLLLYNQLSKFTIAVNIVFFFCGLVILVSGVYTSILQMTN